MPTNQADSSRGLAAFKTLDREDRRAITAWAIGQLPEHLRDVLIMRNVDGLSDAEIGAVLGVHPSSVASMQKKAITLARQLIVG